MSLGHEIKGYGWCEWLWLWTHGSRFYKELRIMDDMCYSKSWAQGSGSYELRVLDDMNDLGSWMQT